MSGIDVDDGMDMDMDMLIDDCGIIDEGMEIPGGYDVGIMVFDITIELLEAAQQVPKAG